MVEDTPGQEPELEGLVDLLTWDLETYYADDYTLSNLTSATGTGRTSNAPRCRSAGRTGGK